MTTTPDAPKTPSTGRGLRLAFGISVALNLAVIGLGIGVALHGGPEHRGDMVRELSFGPFTDALRPADRMALRDRFLATTPDFRAERARMKADTDAVLTALRAQPFDPAALDAALTEMQDHISARMATGTGVMADFLKSLSPADRLAFADRLEGALRHGGRAGDAPPQAPGN